NASLEMGAASTLALLYESMAQPAQAERHLRIAEEAFKRVPAGFEQWKALLSLGPVKARIYLDQKRYKEAESILKTNLSLYSQQPFQVTNMQSQSLMLLAKVYMESGRAQDARRKFKGAAETNKTDDQDPTTD